MRALPAALLVLAGCPKAPPAPDAPTYRYDELWIPGRLDYVEIEQPVDGAATRNVLTESWSPLDPDAQGARWLAETFGLPPRLPGVPPHPGPELPQRLGATRYFANPTVGLAHDATIGPRGESRYEPKVELPPVVSVGMRWEGTHGTGASQNTRQCEVEPTPYCAEGVAVACRISWVSRQTWIRQHWCAGTGWVGYESVRVTPQGASRVWSEEASHDGVDLPVVPIDRRPMPELLPAAP